MTKIYLASSWRNQYQAEVLAALRASGAEVYDFKNPESWGKRKNEAERTWRAQFFAELEAELKDRRGEV